ncbi:MAG: hypothetical protein ACK5A1_18525 [Planctomyces sp.]
MRIRQHRRQFGGIAGISAGRLWPRRQSQTRFHEQLIGR